MPIKPRLTCAARNPCPPLRRCCLASLPKLAERLRRTSKANPEAGAVSPPSVFSEHMLLRGAQRRSYRHNPSLSHDRVQETVSSLTRNDAKQRPPRLNGIDVLSRRVR